MDWVGFWLLKREDCNSLKKNSQKNSPVLPTTARLTSTFVSAFSCKLAERICETTLWGSKARTRPLGTARASGTVKVPVSNKHIHTYTYTHTSTHTHPHTHTHIHTHTNTHTHAYTQTQSYLSHKASSLLKEARLCLLIHVVHTNFVDYIYQNMSFKHTRFCLCNQNTSAFVCVIKTQAPLFV